MYNQHHEIEAIIEDLIDNNIMEVFEGSFNNKKQCLIALEILISKLEDFDNKRFEELFDE